MLKLQSREPEWLDIMPGVRVLFAPIGIKAVREGREAVRETLGEEDEDLQRAGDALTRTLLRRSILEWEGIGGPDGELLPVTPATIEMFLDDPRAFEAADFAYVRPWILRDMEGNASAGSPNGTGAVATPADDIARSPARPRKKGGARSARTGSTKR